MTEYKYIYPHFVGLSKKNNKPNPSLRRIATKSHRFTKKETITCQECGNDYTYLIGHICQIHGLEYYKAKFNITDNKELYPKSYLKEVQESARKVGTSEEAVEARERYWSKDENLKEKSEWMKEEMKSRMNNPEFAEKWHNRESIKKFKERAKERMKKAKKPKTCIACGKTFIPKTVYWGSHKQTNTKRKTCSNKCKRIAYSMREMTKEHRINLALSKKLDSDYILVGTKVRYKKNCVVCGKEFLVNRYRKSGKYEKKTCGHSCSGKIAGEKIKQLYKDPEFKKRVASKYLKYRKGEYKTCKNCGKKFYTHPSTKSQGYCSSVCWSKGNRIIQKCKDCGKDFEVRKSESQIKRCLLHRRSNIGKWNRKQTKL